MALQLELDLSDFFVVDWMTTWPRPLLIFKKVNTSPSRLGVRSFQIYSYDSLNQRHIFWLSESKRNFIQGLLNYKGGVKLLTFLVWRYSWVLRVSHFTSSWLAVALTVTMSSDSDIEVRRRKNITIDFIIIVFVLPWALMAFFSPIFNK